MNKMIVTCVVGAVCAFLASACSSPAEQDESAEEVGQVQEAVTATGYCDVSPSTGLLSGACRCPSMCSAKAHAACPAGAAPIQLGIYTAICGQVQFDGQRRCTQWC